MPTTVVALNILLMLLPGFVSLKASDALTVRRARSDFQAVIEALVFSFINWVLFTLLIDLLGWSSETPFLTVSENKQINLSQFASRNGVLLVVTAYLTGTLHGFVSSKGWYHIFMGWVGFTRKTGQIDVWQDAFSQPQGFWVRVTLDDGTIVEGWPKFYSDNPEARELYLADVRMYKPDGEVQDMGGYLLTGKFDIKTIEFFSGEGDSNGK